MSRAWVSSLTRILYLNVYYRPSENIRRTFPFVGIDFDWTKKTFCFIPWPWAGIWQPWSILTWNWVKAWPKWVWTVLFCLLMLRIWFFTGLFVCLVQNPPIGLWEWQRTLHVFSTVSRGQTQFICADEGIIVNNFVSSFNQLNPDVFC